MKKNVLIASAVLCMVAMGATIEPPSVADFLARPFAERKAILADPVKKVAFLHAVPYSTEAVPHCFRIPTVRNMRDIGGWTGLGGRKVRFGRAYRSAQFNRGTEFKSGRDYSVLFGIEPVSESEKSSAKFGPVMVSAAAIHELVDVLGIRTDLDLRSPHEVYGMVSSPLGSTVRWIFAPMLTYAQLSEPDAMKAVATALRPFASEKNYPIIFHCAGGADRTGAVAFMVNGLCGVSLDDLARDWELTAFGTGHAKNPDFLHATRFDPLAAVVEKYPGETLADRIYAYLLACGLSREELEAIRRLMLEPAA